MFSQVSWSAIIYVFRNFFGRFPKFIVRFSWGKSRFFVHFSHLWFLCNILVVSSLGSFVITGPQQKGHVVAIWVKWFRFRGVAMGRVYRHIYPQKAGQINFSWVNNDLKMVIELLYLLEKIRPSKFSASPKPISGYTPAPIEIRGNNGVTEAETFHQNQLITN